MYCLDILIHQPVRLRIMAATAALPPDDRLDFTQLRELLQLTDGNLGAHLQKLEHQVCRSPGVPTHYRAGTAQGFAAGQFNQSRRFGMKHFDPIRVIEFDEVIRGGVSDAHGAVNVSAGQRLQRSGFGLDARVFRERAANIRPEGF